jgi:hypothetical protein
MGNVLRRKLLENEWRILNDTPLPTVCWNDARSDADNSLERLSSIATQINDSGRAWISTTLMGGVVPVLRATITNYRTQDGDLEALIRDLEWARGQTGQ